MKKLWWMLRHAMYMLGSPVLTVVRKGCDGVHAGGQDTGMLARKGDKERSRPAASCDRTSDMDTNLTVP